MAEGGEGEEEIQFLRTVSPAYFFWGGRANLHWLPEMDIGNYESSIFYFYLLTLGDYGLGLKLTPDVSASTSLLKCRLVSLCLHFNTFGFLALDI